LVRWRWLELTQAKTVERRGMALQNGSIKCLLASKLVVKILDEALLRELQKSS